MNNEINLDFEPFCVLERRLSSKNEFLQHHHETLNLHFWTKLVSQSQKFMIGGNEIIDLQKHMTDEHYGYKYNIRCFHSYGEYIQFKTEFSKQTS